MRPSCSFSCFSVPRVTRLRTAPSEILSVRAASWMVRRSTPRLTPLSIRGIVDHQDRGGKPLEAILAASSGRGRWATLGMERYPDRKHIHIRCDKHTRDFSWLQMYSRILALGVLVRVLVDVATFAV